MFLIKKSLFMQSNRTKYLGVGFSVLLSFFLVFLHVHGASTIGNNITTGGTLSVTGVATASSTFQVTGAVRLYSTLRVDETSTLAGFISASSTATSTLYVGGVLTASSTFQGTGAARLYSTFQADGLSTLAGFISTASSTISSGGLAVTGALTASTSLSVGTGGNASALTGLVAGFCTIPSTSITASTSGMGVQSAACTGATGVRSGDRLFVTATSSLVENNFMILSASSTSNDTIQVMLGETSTSTSGSLATGIHSFNFWSVR